MSSVIENFMINLFRVNQSQDEEILRKNIEIFITRIMEDDFNFEIPDLIPRVENRLIYYNKNNKTKNTFAYKIDITNDNENIEETIFYVEPDNILKLIGIDINQLDEEIKNEWNNNLIRLTLDIGDCLEDFINVVVIDLKLANWILSKNGYLNIIKDVILSEYNEMVDSLKRYDRVDLKNYFI